MPRLACGVRTEFHRQETKRDSLSESTNNNNNKRVAFGNQLVYLAKCRFDDCMDMNFESCNGNTYFVIGKILFAKTEAFNFVLWDMCSHPDLINIQSKAHGQLGLVYFLLPGGYFLSRFVVLSSVFVFASDEKTTGFIHSVQG